ncbi:MAG TPA: hypothetical protein PLW06_15570, partial [Phocaeicola vulgatus]|nr:hypothetical protein [Phocaeicola vulgatus]
KNRYAKKTDAVHLPKRRMQGVPDTMKFLYEEDFRDEIYKKMKKSHYIVPVHHDFMVKLNILVR